MPMRDPHVVAIIYKAEAPDGFYYHEPPAVEAETAAFRISLVNWQLRIEPKDHFASREEIQPLADAFARSWSIASSLERGFPEIEFEYESAEVIERAPPRDGTIEGHAVMKLGTFTVTGTATVRSERYAYPLPPLGFTTSPDVETLWNRYQGYLRGREPLPSMAFFAFTVLTSVAGGFKQASARFSISRPVLTQLRELSSTRGDIGEARKLEAHRPIVALSQADRIWLDRAVREIIKRVGQAAAGLKPDKLRMSDLPPVVKLKRTSPGKVARS